MGNEKYLVSIIIAAYNCEKTIIRAIDSALNQTYKNIELIIIDDGSKDKTLELINEINDSRIVVLTQKNSGPGVARNYGIKVAKGDFILFCDADDKLDEEIVDKFIKCIQKKYYDVVLFKTIRLDENENIIKTPDVESMEIQQNEKELLIKSIYNKFDKYNNIFGFDATWGKFVSRKLIKDNNILFPENIYRFEDGTFCKKVYEVAKNIYYLNKAGYYYYRNNQSLCNKYNENAISIYYDALTVLGEGLYNDNDFYIKCITTLTECEKLYFLNKQYNKSYNELKKEYYEMIERKYYIDAIEKVDFSTIPIHYKVEIILLKNKFLDLYLIFKKMYFMLKGGKI